MEYILGVGASLLVAYLKKRFETDEYKTLGVLLFVSILGAGGYWYLGTFTEFLPTIVEILTIAGAFYAFVIRRFQD